MDRYREWLKKKNDMISENKFFFLAIIMIIGFSIVLRLNTVDFDRDILSGDEPAYHNAAEIFIRDGCFTVDRDGSILNGDVKPQPSSMLQIGYPVFVAVIYSIFGHNPFFVFVSQFILNILDLLLICYIMWKCNCKKGAMIIALALAGLYPGSIYNINRMLTEQLFGTLILLFVSFFIAALNDEEKNSVKYCISAVFIGAATFTRGLAFALFLLGSGIIIVYVKKNLKKNILVWVGTFVLTQAWWWIRNFVQFGRFILLTDAGENPKIWGLMPYYLDMASAETMNAAELLNLDKQINFGLYMRWRIFGSMNYLWRNIWDENLVHDTLRGFLWIQLLIILVGILLPIIIKRCNVNVLLITSFPIAFTLMNMLYHGLPRYLYPAMPFVFISLALLISNNSEVNISCKNNTIFKIRYILEKIYFGFSIIFSVLLFFSIFVFSCQMETEMSEWRLNKYAGLSIEELRESNIIESKIYYKEDVEISNSIFKDGKYVNETEGPCTIRIDVDGDLKDNVVTKVELNISGGYLYDYMVVYWQKDGSRDWNENQCYIFPTNVFEKSHTIYIDGDITGLWIVPNKFQYGKFIYDYIGVTQIEY